MQIRLYNKKKWVTICLLAGLTLGFRGCCNRHFGAETSEEMHRLLRFYNGLLPQQQKDLWAAFEPLSKAEQGTLQHLVAGLSKQELESVKELGDMFGQPSKDGNRTNLFEILFTVLLEKGYTIEKLKGIINNMEENKKSSTEPSDDSKEFMKAIISKYFITELMDPDRSHALSSTQSLSQQPDIGNKSSSSERSSQDPPPEVENKDYWDEELKNLTLDAQDKQCFIALLKKYDKNKQKILHSLFKKREQQYKNRFITVLMGKTPKIQKELADDLLLVHGQHPTIAEKICTGDILDTLDQASIVSVIATKYFWGFKARVQNLQQLKKDLTKKANKTSNSLP